MNIHTQLRISSSKIDSMHLCLLSIHTYIYNTSVVFYAEVIVRVTQFEKRNRCKEWDSRQYRLCRCTCIVFMD